MRSLRIFVFSMMFMGSVTSTRADEIDDYVNAELARQHAPGLALAIMKDGQLVRAQGYGFANLEHHVPVHADTVFQTGSVGMQFTAVAVMLLVEDGKLQLDDSIRKYLPAAPKSWAPITIRQLLNHTSGLPQTPNGNIRREYTDDELLEIIYGQPLDFKPGVHWSFGYTDYGVLGMVINKVTGKFYTDFLAKRIFVPLGMQTARLIDDRAIVPNRAAGYQVGDGGLGNQHWVSATANSTADGSLYLSVLDYARWNAAQFGRKLLKPESWSEIIRPAQLANGARYPYGLGWFIDKSEGKEVWWHPGAWGGFQNFVIHYPREELTIVAFANSENSDPRIIVRHIAGLLDPAFMLPRGVPIEDREPQVTNRLKSLLQQIATGKVDDRDFTLISAFELGKLKSDWHRTLQPLGVMNEIALFSREMLGNDQVYRYRARYEGGLLEANLSYAPNGKIARLELARVDDWNGPLQPADDGWNATPLSSKGEAHR